MGKRRALKPISRIVHLAVALLLVFSLAGAIVPTKTAVAATGDVIAWDDFESGSWEDSVMNRCPCRM